MILNVYPFQANSIAALIAVVVALARNVNKVFADDTLFSCDDIKVSLPARS